MSEELKAKDDEILELFKMCNKKDKEIERLNNIIKEVREYLEMVINTPDFMCLDMPRYILEILDKENI